jgi:hypothetical protein
MASATVIFHMDNGTEVTFHVDSEKTGVEMRKAFVQQEFITFTTHTGDVRVVNTAKANGMTVHNNAY